MTTDLSTLTRDQLERLAAILIGLCDMAEGPGYVDTDIIAILSEPRPEPHPWTVREALLCITDVLEAHVRFADMKQQGMSVPFHGDFADAMRLPSFVGRVRWWARELRAALDSPRSEPRQAPVPTDREVVEAWAKAGAGHRSFTVFDREMIFEVWKTPERPAYLYGVTEDTLDAAYAAAAAWVKEQGK